MQPDNPARTDDRSKSPRARVPTDILIEVQGEDFAYAGETVTVSLHGALISTSACLKIGMPIFIYVHRTGKSAQAHVVFAGFEKKCQYGIELDRPDNIWGLSGAPLDWISPFDYSRIR